MNLSPRSRSSIPHPKEHRVHRQSPKGQDLYGMLHCSVLFFFFLFPPACQCDLSRKPAGNCRVTVHACTCVRAHPCVCTCVFKYMYVHMCASACMGVQVPVFKCVCVRVCACVFTLTYVWNFSHASSFLLSSSFNQCHLWHIGCQRWIKNHFHD